jgi:hypothetical protein
VISIYHPSSTVHKTTSNDKLFDLILAIKLY